MKRLIPLAILLVCILCACSTQRVPPGLNVKSIGGDESEDIVATMGTYSWDYDIGAVEADSPHPLDMKDIATIANVPEEVELVFHDHVIDYTVRRWAKGAEYEDFDTVETVDDRIVIPDDADISIYEVTVEYKNGTVHYAFQVGE